MTTNKPGSVNQQPLFVCIICYGYVTYPADHLRVYNGECWCESCWEYATHEITDGLDWGELEPFRPMLNTEYEKLQTEYEQLVSYTKNGIECFANPCPEHSGVNTPPFSEFQERYGQLCLMCVVDERDTLRAECEKLRACLAETAGVAVTMLYESHKADTIKEFTVEQLSQMVENTKHLADANVQVEKVYRKAWDMAHGCVGSYLEGVQP